MGMAAFYVRLNGAENAPNTPLQVVAMPKQADPLARRGHTFMPVSRVYDFLGGVALRSRNALSYVE